jgi:ubiquitin C-terminal hydrolase
MSILLSILMPDPKDDPSSPAGGAGSPSGGVGGGNVNLNGSAHNNNPTSTPTRKANTLVFNKRRSSLQTSSSHVDSMEDSETPQTEVMERLRHQLNASGSTPDSSFVLDDYCDEAARHRFFHKASAWLKLHPVASSISQMTIFDFATFAESALDDGCLSAVMHRLFGHGWILNPSLEHEMVKSRWREWQEHSDSLALWSRTLGQPAEGTLEIISQNVRKVLENGNGTAAAATGSNRSTSRQHKPFGGLGGFDGRGGIGFGIMYCIDKDWWDAWEAYVGWSWAGDAATTPPSPTGRIRPRELSAENLLNRDDDFIVAGAYGSYEVMKKGLEKDVHYVLVPPGVWDVLYEIYGGGPPLPRMVSPPEQKGGTGGAEAAELDIEIRSVQGGSVLSTGRDRSAPTELDLDAMASTDNADRVLRIPRLMDIESHPWVVHVHLCDPHQPYRKGHNDAGPMTIRAMVSPDQPLWRLYAELAVRLPFHLYRAYGPDGRGKARLWKRLEADAPKDPSWRYGPWPCALLCKNRFALLPRQSTEQELEEHYDELRENWEAYADHATVESIGLSDGSQMIVEFAIVHKNGEMIWPREAAAKAGRERRLADTDRKFRNMLRGLDVNGKALAKSPELVGMAIDAMDTTGRWYEVRIIQVQTMVTDTDEEDDDSDDDAPGHVYDLRKDNGEQKQVRVDFSKYGGHAEWIDVDSDRLATAGRFTLANGDDAPEAPAKPGPAVTTINDTKNKTQTQVKKAAPENGDSNIKICPIPGYGACGLANLGNTCYINAALQCISYFPLLRAYLISGEYKTTGDLNKDNPLGTDGKLLEEFVDLLRLMWSAKVGEKSPTRFRGLIAKLNSDFAGADQQDAQELLSYVLDGLMEDSNRVRKKPYVEGLEDDWVKDTCLLRVGEEAWRRHLRRSRSIITDIATGQLMSTTTCPVCNFSSRSFDPFNLLSVPLPTVAEVLFKIYIVRRANAFNTPWVLNKPKSNGKFKARFDPQNGTSAPKSQSEEVVVEQHIIAMSRLADSSDLRLKIQALCGIPAADLRICSAEEKLVASEQDVGTVVQSLTEVSLLTEKKGPCSSLARQRTTSEDLGTSPSTPSLIIAFESTLRARPVDTRAESADGVDESSEHSAEEDEDDTNDGPSKKEERELERLVLKYGNSEECRLYDTDALPIAMAISRSIWPTKEEELKIGLRVDAIDHKEHWYPGSIVEILDGGSVNGESKESESTAKTKVRVHFDTFSSKWDEMYTMDHFREGRVKPLYSHAAARTNATEFIVHHRYTDRRTRATCLFGQPFYVKCHSEWSMARAGAQILSQASRYLRLGPMPDGPVDVDGAQEREAKVERLYERTHTVISDLIDVLIECDRDYVRGALGVTNDPNNQVNGVKRFRNPSFDASAISSSLVKRVQNLIHRLPFDVRVCMVDSPLGSSNEEAPFPFSLIRSIGNYMSARHAIVLQWREPPSDKKAVVPPPNAKYSNYLGAPVMYVPPEVVMDEASAELLNKANQKAKKAPSARGSGGLPLGICITEFCKVQTLSKDDTWRCPRCKDFRTGASQNLVLWRLPDLLTVHMKRFHCSTKWREKITTKVNFPLTGLDMKEWCHPESPVIQNDSRESYVYDLIGVLNHYGGMTGGHYVATCKATPCSKDGREEVAYDFNGVGTTMPVPIEEDVDVQTGWKFGRQKVEVNQNKVAAAATAKAAGESAEPLWLQFDDDVVEPIPPRHVVSETAYVLFYRRRRLTPANVARYSTLE